MVAQARTKKSDVFISKRKRPESLTEREKEILQLIWSGLKNKEIAQRLKISVKTVEAHRANMMKKVRVLRACHLAHVSTVVGIQLQRCIVTFQEILYLNL